MDCEDYCRRYLDNDWTRSSLSDAVKVAEHLCACVACRKAADQYDQVRHVLGSADSLSELRMTRRPAKAASATRPISIWVAATAAIAPVLAASVIGWMVYVQTQHKGLAKQAAKQPDEPVAFQVAGTQPPATSHQPPTTPSWTAEDIHRGVQVFQEVSATFDGRTSWVALGDRSADFGLDTSNVDSVGLDNRVGTSPTPQTVLSVKPRVFLLRLVFFRGRDEKSRTDLVIVAGQNARMDLPLEPGRILHYVIGTTVGAPPKLSLWTEVRSPHGGETVAVLATQMRPHSGDTLNAGHIMTSSGEYSLEVSFMEETLPGLPGPEKLKS